MSESKKTKVASKKKKAPAAAASATYVPKETEKELEPLAQPRLLKIYYDKMVPELMRELGYTNVMQVPRLLKITLNMGLGAAVGNPNLIKSAATELSAIAGQRAVVTRAKKAIANFKLRAGLPIGCMVTLRKRVMWEFLDRLFTIAMPRLRDFKGVSPKAFDGQASYSLGFREHIMFPEIRYDTVDAIKGLNITFTTSAKNLQQCKVLLKHLGMPFRH